jgi:hypothetical protein
VNDFSVAAGAARQRAVETLLQVYRRVNPGSPEVPASVFL